MAGTLSTLGKSYGDRDKKSMRGCLIGLSKLALGGCLALILFALAGVITARYFMAQLAVLPTRPVYSNDRPEPEAPAAAEAPSPVVTAPVAPPAPPDPPGSYEAIVNQPIGLILRAGPGTQFERLGGIDNNTRILVLGEDDSREWLNVRLRTTGQEGWIKGGNIRPATTP